MINNINVLAKCITTSFMITHKECFMEFSNLLSPAGNSLTVWSTWVSRWKRSSSSSSATWSTRRSMAPRRASRQSKRKPWSLWKLKATMLPNNDQIRTIIHTCCVFMWTAVCWTRSEPHTCLETSWRLWVLVQIPPKKKNHQRLYL